jgi:hypothetical protein
LGYNLLDDGVSSVGQTTLRVGGAASLETWRPQGGTNQSVGAEIYTENFTGGGEVDMQKKQTVLTVGYGAQVNDDVVVGVSAALYDGKMAAGAQPVTVSGANHIGISRTSTGGDFKVGGLFRVGEQATVGVVAGYGIGSYNEKGAWTVDQGSGTLNRWNLRVGGGYQLSDNTLLASDVFFSNLNTELRGLQEENSRSWGVSAGIEQQVLPETLVLRGGLYYDRASYSSKGKVSLFSGADSFSKASIGFTAGAAVRLFAFDLGYSLDVNTRGDLRNIFDLSAEW